MDHHEATAEADNINLNRLSVVSEEDQEQDAAITIVTVLDKVANIVDTVQASQKRIEERHQTMENAIKSIQIDILKLAQAHSNTGYTVNKLLDKTRKVSSNVKEVKARVDKQSDNVQKVEAKQEEMLRKNKFRVVIYQDETPCPTRVTVAKHKAVDGELSDEFYPPADLSSDEEYTLQESRASRLKKSGMKRIDNIKKAFSKESMQKTRQNFGKKVNRIRTRIVTPERRERIRQSGERLKQSGERFKQSISKAVPKKEAFKININKKGRERTGAEGKEGSRTGGIESVLYSGAIDPTGEEITYTEVITVVKKKKEASTETDPPPLEEKPLTSDDHIELKQEVKAESDKAPLLDLKQSS
ncbi:caveolae-associated protein 4 [Rhinatrema bivittatum]|uniref:caveolae-associated protein 4 n=1 Tax=Rhinatrema bivittatum TaxID=194408 RepID=UPI001125E68F|nr:caveolae-associated protein 4 [Rhinatrema bivittatum]